MLSPSPPRYRTSHGTTGPMDNPALCVMLGIAHLLFASSNNHYTWQSPGQPHLCVCVMLGIAHLLFASSNNHYTWRKVTTTVNNIIVGRLWVDNHGEMDIKNHTTGDNCHLKFYAYSYFSREVPRKVCAHSQLDTRIINIQKLNFTYLFISRYLSLCAIAVYLTEELLVTLCVCVCVCLRVWLLACLCVCLMLMADGPRVEPGHPSSLVKMYCVFWFTFVCSFSALTLLVGSFDP